MSKNQATSKFAGILAAKHDQYDKPEEKRTTHKTNVQTKNEISPTAPTQKNDSETNNEVKRGRPPAKRSNPDFVQTSPYIRKSTLLAVKSKLLHEGEKREYSELVEELLTEWLNG